MYELSTTTKIIRIEQAIAQYTRLLNKELSYLPHNQNSDMIAEYRAHIVRLEMMLLELNRTPNES